MPVRRQQVVRNQRARLRANGDYDINMGCFPFTNVGRLCKTLLHSVQQLSMEQ